ncbi:putative casein kinase-1 hhp1 [Armillaria nabsnona]|nr:putative casein kinase-1 hhp1 [Armillaria nabsnona]
MSSARLTYRHVDRGTLDDGAYATELASRKTVALKMSRVSKRVKRPILQHETRILQLLKGHASIPVIYAYGQLEHFEYIAMEILGPTIRDQQKKNSPGTSLILPTVVRIMDQGLAGLEHIHFHGIVNRDIKPENLLCALDNLTVKIIDFGMLKLFYHGQPSKYKPFKNRKAIIGSLYWASLNSHNGVAPHDVIESVAYVALFLLRGHLPWKPRPHSEPDVRSQEIVRFMKSSCSGKDLSSGFPVEFGDLLDYSRSLEFDQLPDYGTFRRLFVALIEGMSDGLLDWTPCITQLKPCLVDEPQLGIPPEGEDYDVAYEDLGKDSYRGMVMGSSRRARQGFDLAPRAEGNSR